MYCLTRNVRFAVNPQDARAGRPPAPKHNGYGGWPAMSGLGVYFEIDVTCTGVPDPSLGFFVNIKEIDAAVRRAAIPLVNEAVVTGGPSPPLLLPRLIRAIDEALPAAVVTSVTWRLTPTLSYTLEGDSMTECIVRQQFEFAASHRLHSDQLSAEENERIFGKCNWKNGHGHNYRLSVAVNASSTPEGSAFDLDTLEQVVDETVIERFDHKHLNLDCPEFAELNPSVENIARVCYELLRRPLAGHGMNLREVTIWETEKTSCVYSSA